MYQPNPFGSVIVTFAIWIVQLFIAYLIYLDAREQKMLAPVWTILAILPMFGYLTDLVYLVLREVRSSRKTETPPAL